MASLQQVQQLAKQGNPKAISVLLNHSLSKEGLQSTISRHGAQLQIKLTGSKPPHRNCIQRLEMGLKRLSVSGIQQVQIQAFQSDRPQQAVWQHSIILTPGDGSPAAPRQQKSPALGRVVSLTGAEKF